MLGLSRSSQAGLAACVAALLNPGQANAERLGDPSKQSAPKALTPRQTTNPPFGKNASVEELQQGFFLQSSRALNKTKRVFGLMSAPQ